MSDPLTLATIALTAANAVGQANAARARGNESAAVSEHQANTAKKLASRGAADLQRRNTSLLASRRVRFGKGGIILSGTPLDLLADAAAENELAVQDALYEGDATAAGHRIRANIARRAGRETRRQGLLIAGTQLLGQVGSISRQTKK